MLDIQTIKTELQTLLPQLQQENGIKQLYIFGSFAKNEQQPNSDIDILYEMLPNQVMTLNHFLTIKKLLERHFGKKIDFVPYSNVNPIIWDNIKNDLIYVT